MKKYLFILLLFLSKLGFAQMVYKEKHILLSSPFEITVIAKDSTEGKYFATISVNELKRIEDLISEWKPSSQVSLINKNAGIKPVKVDFELFQLIEKALKFSKLTDGAFDISFASMDKIWKFDGSMKEIPTPEQVKQSVRNVGYKNILMNVKDTTVFL